MKKQNLIYGVGTNDSDYDVYHKLNGKIIWRCPFYRAWASMLERCYSQKWHIKQPTYKDCSVCEEWMIFSKFKKWMEQQDWENKQLDKDLLTEGNKVYSPKTCIFVNRKINNFIIDSAANRGNYLIGVTWDKRVNKFLAQCRNPFTGKQEKLGRFIDELEAHLAWKHKKHQHACALANSEYCTDPRLSEVLKSKYL